MLLLLTMPIMRSCDGRERYGTSTHKCTLSDRKAQSGVVSVGQSIKQDDACLEDIDIPEWVVVVIHEQEARRLISDELPIRWHVNEETTQDINGDGWRARQVVLPNWVHMLDLHIQTIIRSLSGCVHG